MAGEIGSVEVARIDNSEHSPFTALEEQGVFEPLATYNFAVEQADLVTARAAEAFSDIEGIALVSEVAKRNMTQAADSLLEAYYTCQQGGKAVINLFGRYHTMTSVDQVQAALDKIGAELAEVNDPETDFLTQGINIVDKYLFDTQEDEAQLYTPSVLVLEDDGRGVRMRRINPEAVKSPPEDRFSTLLEKEGIVSVNSSPININPDSLTVKKLSDQRADDDPRLLAPEDQDFDIVVVEAKGGISFNWSTERLTQLRIDLWRLPPEKKPKVIIYTDGVKPALFETADFQPMTLVSNMDELRTSLALCKSTVAQLRGQPRIEPQVLAKMQEEQYDNSFDLRDWEKITADTEQSLRHLLHAFKKRERQNRMELPAVPSIGIEKPIVTEWIDDRVQTVLDGGTGDGRTAGLLARLGYRVVGVDISEEQLKRGEQRFIEEGQGLRGEREDSEDLAFPALLHLQQEGSLPRSIITDDEVAKANYITVKGDFMHLFSRMESLARREWQDHSDYSIWDFFNVPPHLREVGVETFGYFGNNIGFDAAMFNWHTFCELSTLADQQQVARQIFDLLMPRGLFILEVPDRAVDPYATLVREYHSTHPQERFGTRRDVYSTEEGEGEFSPRYFPSRHELTTMLQSAGFVLDPQEDIQTYLITSEDEEGKTRLNAKELFIVAHKPDPSGTIA